MALTLLVMVAHDVDVVPRWVKYDLLVPYRIKGIPGLVAWFVMQWELLVTARSTARIDTGSFSPPASAAGRREKHPPKFRTSPAPPRRGAPIAPCQLSGRPRGSPLPTPRSPRASA